MRKLILILIIVFAFLLRVVAIDRFPTGFTQDEAGIGYDAYSILKTGRDEWGSFLPITLRSFGDFKLPLYSYLAVPSVAIFGLNEFSVRLTSVIFGTLAVFVTYLMVKKLTGRYDLAAWSSFLLSISSWHISLSRGAFEANLVTFFIPLAVWTFLLGLEKPKVMIISAFAFGISLFSYHSARFFIPLFLVLLTVIYRKEIFRDFSKASLLNEVKKYLPALMVLLLFIALAFYSMTIGGGKRASDVTIVNPTGGWSAVADRRYEAVLGGLPDSVARLFSNKVGYVFRQFYSNYLSYLSPTFLFVQGAGEWTYGMISGRGVLYLFELLLLLPALVYFFRNKGFKGMGLVMIWILISPLAAALTKGPGYAANRVALMMPAIQILSAYGIVILNEKFILKSKWRKPDLAYKLAILIVLLTSFSIFAEDYLFHAPILGAKDMHYGVSEAISYLRGMEGNYDNIVVSRSLSVPQIWVAFYEKWDPRDFQKESVDWLRYENQSLGFVDQLGSYSLGKYIFTSIGDGINKDKKILYLGRPGDFKQSVKPSLVVSYPDKTPAFYIVEGKNLK